MLSNPTKAAPRFDIPGMGRMTAAEFAEAYSARGEGGPLVVLGPSRLEWRDDKRGARHRFDEDAIKDLANASGHWTPHPQPSFASLFEPRRYRDPLFYIGAPPC